MNKKQKARVSFCWHCGRKLMHGSYVEKEVDGHKRIMHKQCYKFGGDFYDRVG